MNDQNSQVQIKLNSKMKKAIMAGEGYDDLETLLQFYNGTINELVFRVERIEKRIGRLYERISIENEDGVITLKCTNAAYGAEETADNTALCILYTNAKGKVEFFTRNLCGVDELRDTIAEYLWAAAMLPLYYEALRGKEAELKAIQNSAAISALSNISKQVNSDLFTKIRAVSGYDIKESGGRHDPYGMFAEEGP